MKPSAFKARVCPPWSLPPQLRATTWFNPGGTWVAENVSRPHSVTVPSRLSAAPFQGPAAIEATCPNSFGISVSLLNRCPHSTTLPSFCRASPKSDPQHTETTLLSSLGPVAWPHRLCPHATSIPSRVRAKLCSPAAAIRSEE